MSTFSNEQITQLLSLLSAQTSALDKLVQSPASPPDKSIKHMKPVISLEKFLEDFKVLPATKLNTLSIPEYYTYCILSNLEKIDDMPPIVLISRKNKTLCFYTDEEWKRNKTFINKIRSVIYSKVCGLMVEMRKTNIDEAMSYINIFYSDKYSIEQLNEKVIELLCKKLDEYDYTF